MYEKHNGDPVVYFTNKYENSSVLGNNREGDGYRFRGRGYIHLTGRYNYHRLTDEVTRTNYFVNIERSPDAAIRLGLSARIAAYGMKHGRFGRKLADYGSDGSYDFQGARAIVNNTAKEAESIAVRISIIAHQYRNAIAFPRSALWEEESVHQGVLQTHTPRPSK